MSSLDLEEPWGLLVLVEGGEEVRVPMVGNRLTIGRGKDADIVTDNKLVSTFHCTLLRGEDGLVWIRDTSTNGTLLNGKKLERNKEVQLSNGDIIRVVFRKERPDCNVAYRFHDLRPLESDTTIPLSEATLEMTQEYQEVEGYEGAADNKKHPLEGGEGPPSAKRVAAGETKKGPRLELKTKSDAEREEGGKDVPNLKTSAEAAPLKPKLIKKDSIEETLLCEICQEILHDCVSLQPCMHSYCAGCYSDWMGHSNTCPACRNVVERISKNHIVNNLVEAYLRAHPEKKRAEEDLKELDKKNKITKDMLYPKKKYRRFYDDDDDDDDDDYTDTSSRSPTPFPTSPHMFTSIFTTRTHFPPAPLFLCRQCPSFVDTGLSSTSHPSPPPFTCSPGTNHVLCMCCLQPMPDRRLDTDLSIPPQKCDICGQAYCHMYWGCRKVGCRGCLNLFKDVDFDESCLASILNNGNLYESRILKEYLQSSSLTVKDVLEACCQKLDEGEYTCADSRTARISSTTRTCYKCAMKNFQDLAYLYRRDIPNDNLPAEVTSRSDCYWGRNCRTQRNKPHHAERFNHICEQIRRI